MEIQGYFTRKGLALSTKLLTGAVLTVTRVVAGGGNTGDPMAAAFLSQPMQTLAVNTPTRTGNTATIPVTLAAALSEGAYTLTELGVYARDPEEGEILYKLYRLAEPVEISPDSRLVLRFYLQETVSQDLNVAVSCSPAGLLTEEMLAPVRECLEARTVSAHTVSLDASELQAYLDALPRLLTKHITINTTGTLEGDLALLDLYGSGSLTINGGGGCVIKGKLLVSGCRIRVNFSEVAFEADAGLDFNTPLATVQLCNMVWFDMCTFRGNGACIGMRANLSSGVLISKCGFFSFGKAIMASGSSILTVLTALNENYTDNAIGAFAYNGGLIMLGEDVPNLLGGSANAKCGGIIAAADGTLL